MVYMTWEDETQQSDQQLQWEMYCYEQEQYELYLKYEAECLEGEYEYTINFKEDIFRL